MSGVRISIPAHDESTSCRSLLQELQDMWDEIGEGDFDRDKIILQLEQECLNVYRKKVDQTRKHKAYLHQTLAEGEAEVSNIISTLGERESFVQSEKPKGTLKEQVAAISPLLEDLRQKKEIRVKEFSDVQMQIARIYAEMAGDMNPGGSASLLVDERDLTVKRLADMKAQLQELQRDKNVRLQKVNAHIKSIYELSTVMSVDFNEMLCEVHPTFGNSASAQPKSISNDTLARLAGTVHSLKQDKKERLQKIQGLGSTLIELWSLMDTTKEEQKRFDHVTSLISASVDDMLGQGCLAPDVIEQAEIEVQKLNIMKASKMKELVLKRQNELEEIYRGVHMDVDCDTSKQGFINLIDSGSVDLSQLLSGMDDRIMKAKEQALSRKDILEKVDKWKFASEEEKWLEDYERDQNRYSAGRGAHKNLKRAEKARALVSKITPLIENLSTKIIAWEKEKGMRFLYDKVHLLETLDEYTMLRQQREEDKRRSREQKRLQEQFATEHEALFGSKPSPMRQPSVKKPLGQISNINTACVTPTNRRVSTAPGRYGISSSGKDRKENGKAGMVIPLNYVALPKDDPSLCNRSAIVSP